MVLPVELDRSRPIYCENCIEIVREERKKGKGKPPTKPPVKVEKPARPSEGKVIERVVAAVPVSLEVLKPTSTPPKEDDWLTREMKKEEREPAATHGFSRGPNGEVNVTQDVSKKKRKRKRKKKFGSAQSSVPPSPPQPAPISQPQSGSIRQGQSIKFD
jgi:hypothetical protein